MANWTCPPARSTSSSGARSKTTITLGRGFAGCSRGNNPDLRGHQEEQVVRAGEYFCEPCDVDITVFNHSKKPEKLLIVELVLVGPEGFGHGGLFKKVDSRTTRFRA